METQSPRISVVVPLFNKQHEITQCLDSVLKQSYAPSEIIVVDDGSTDASRIAVLCFDDPRIKLIEQANGGVSAARNTGIRNASCDLIAFIDADDFWAVHFLEQMVELRNQFPSALAYASAYQYSSDQGFKVPRFFEESMPSENVDNIDYFDLASRGDLPFCASSIAITRNAFSSIGMFPVGEAMGEDQDMWCRLALSGDIAYCPRALAFYRLEAENRACLSEPPTNECGFSKRLSKISDDMANSHQKRAIDRYIGSHLRDLANRNIEFGKPATAATILSNPRSRIDFTRYAFTYLKLVGAFLSKGHHYSPHTPAATHQAFLSQ